MGGFELFAPTSPRPRVALLALGGTIDSLGASRLDHVGYVEERRRLPDEHLLAELPELGEIAEIVPEPFPRSPSQELDLATWSSLAASVSSLGARHDIDGVVMTHGTNTLEETAYFLRLATAPEVPVVLTGALRPWNALGSDGPMNLWQAVRYAASGTASPGVSVGLNGRIWDPRHVTKLDAYRLEAFGSLAAGPVACVEADGAVRDLGWGAPGLAGGFAPLTEPAAWPRVDIVASFVGADGMAIDAAVEAGAAGVVVAGLGPGAVTPAQDAAIDRAVVHGVVVCLSTRLAAPLVPPRAALRERGVLAAGHLRPQQARILLLLALASGCCDVGALQHALDAETAAP